MADPSDSVNALLDRIADRVQGGAVSVGDVVETLGHRGFGPFLILVPLLEISPIGGIPGLPTALALTIALVAVQLALGRDHLWLPTFLRLRTLTADHARAAIDKVRKPARMMDRWFHGRLPALTREPFPRLAAAAILVLCATVPPLELLPFATTAPMLAIAAFGVAITMRDGLLMLVAVALAVAAALLGIGIVGR